MSSGTDASGAGTNSPRGTFNPAPGWPTPPPGWVPEPGWSPDPSWPPAPAGWQYWTTDPADLEVGGSEPHGGNAAKTPAPSVIGADIAAAVSAATPDDLSGVQNVSDRLAVETRKLQAVRAELGTVRAKVANELTRLEALRAEATELEASPTPSSAPMRDDAPADDLYERMQAAKRELIELDDAILLQQVGIYEYHHPLENADAFKARLETLRDQIKQTVRDGVAILASERFAYNNSLAQGRKMTADFSKLMLRAYNAEADSCVRSLRAGSLAAASKRLETAVTTIAKLGAMMEMRVSADYHMLRVQELELTSDYLFMVQEEREAAREERERLREERKAEQELAAERQRLDKERSHYANALRTLVEQGKQTEADELRERLSAIDEAIRLNDYRAANIRAGYVYVISNVGAFGPRVVKIGMTRRLEPMDRVKELGDASVPFPFDVHALYFSDDAVTLENELHAAFADRKLNHVNARREFFFATPNEVRDVLLQKVGSLLEFVETPDAVQFNQSRSAWPEDSRL